MTQAFRNSLVRNQFSSATSKQVAHHLAEPVNFIRESPAQKKPVAVIVQSDIAAKNGLRRTHYGLATWVSRIMPIAISAASGSLAMDIRFD
jgi:2-polyprenyl-3-methyl-5-hydroxy-6-metoxy-1,4-benzoquinol methylase